MIANGGGHHEIMLDENRLYKDSLEKAICATHKVAEVR